MQVGEFFWYAQDSLESTASVELRSDPLKNSMWICWILNRLAWSHFWPCPNHYEEGRAAWFPPRAIETRQMGKAIFSNQCIKYGLFSYASTSADMAVDQCNNIFSNCLSFCWSSYFTVCSDQNSSGRRPNRGSCRRWGIAKVDGVAADIAVLWL